MYRTPLKIRLVTPLKIRLVKGCIEPFSNQRMYHTWRKRIASLNKRHLYNGYDAREGCSHLKGSLITLMNGLFAKKHLRVTKRIGKATLIKQDVVITLSSFKRSCAVWKSLIFSRVFLLEINHTPVLDLKRNCKNFTAFWHMFYGQSVVVWHSLLTTINPHCSQHCLLKYELEQFTLKGW